MLLDFLAAAYFTGVTALSHEGVQVPIYLRRWRSGDVRRCRIYLRYWYSSDLCRRHSSDLCRRHWSRCGHSHRCRGFRRDSNLKCLTREDPWRHSDLHLSSGCVNDHRLTRCKSEWHGHLHDLAYLPCRQRCCRSLRTCQYTQTAGSNLIDAHATFAA